VAISLLSIEELAMKSISYARSTITAVIVPAALNSSRADKATRAIRRKVSHCIMRTLPSRRGPPFHAAMAALMYVSALSSCSHLNPA
jgi:hypothetical protein